jgi:MFS family permease
MDAVFFMPVATLYFATKGVDIAGFFLIQGLFRVAMIVLEIPTGYVADRWTRARQIQLAHVIWVAYTIMLALAHSFGSVLLAEVVCALALSFASGTVQAYLHEALRHEGRAPEQTAWQGRLFAASLAAESAAGLVGGWMFSANPELPMLLTVLFGAVALAVSLSFRNVPRIESPRRHANPLADLALVVHHSLRVHPRLPMLLMGPNMMFGFTGVLFWAIQARLNTLHVSPGMMGAAMAGYFGIKAGLALAAGRIHQRAARHFAPALVALLTVGTGLMLINNPLLVWLGGVLGGGAVHAIGSPINTTLINAEVPDGERATVLSVASMISRSIGAVMLIASGPLLTVVSLQTVLVGYLVLTLALVARPSLRLMRANAPQTP